MSEPPRPRPRPGPRPSPGPPASSGPAGSSGPAHLPGRSRRPSRLARRRAERRLRTRRLLSVVGALAAVLGVGMFAVVALRHGAGTGHRADRPARRARTSDVAVASSASGSTPAAAGATLLDSDQAVAFLAGASSDLAAVTSYDYRHLDDALSAGLAVTTGAYRDAYRAALTGPVADEARQQHVVQSFQELAAGIGAIDADGTQGTVLVFGLQTRSDDSTHGKPRNQLVTLTATIDHAGDSYLISRLVTDGANAGLPPGSPDLTLAAEAGRAEVADSLSYTRAGFGHDLQRALGGAAEPLRGEIADAAPRTKAAMVRGGFDLVAGVTAIAVQSAQGSRVDLLVAATGYRVADDGTRSAATSYRDEVVVTLRAGRWVTTAITPIEAS